MLKLSVIFLCYVITTNILDTSFLVKAYTKIILVEDAKVCFRRVLAGKRVAGAFVKKSVPCERLDDCQRECNDEKRFVCEGFNYRLDQTGRGQGVCELVEFPLSRMDIGRDLYPDKDYDFYERDRNSIPPDCRPVSGNPYPPSSGGYLPERGWNDFDRRPPTTAVGRPFYEPPRRPYLPERPSGYERPVFPYGQSDRNFYADRRPIPPPVYNDRRYLPYPDYFEKKYYYDRERDRNYWGLDSERGHVQKHWASYGGSYGNFGGPDSYYGGRYLPKKPPPRYPEDENFIPYRIGGGTIIRDPTKSYGYNHDRDTSKYWGLEPPKYGGGGYLPYDPPKPDYGSSIHYGGVGTGGFDRWSLDGSYGRPVRPISEVGYGIPVRPLNEIDYGQPVRPLPPPPVRPPIVPPVRPLDDGYGSGRPAQPLGDDFRPSYGPIGGSNFDNRYDCSRRSGTGLRMMKDYVRKFFLVTNIYECEKLCFMEKHFPCYSYSFRYTITTQPPTENCYLSDKPVTSDSMYMDTEPNRDFDIYEVNRGGKNCMRPNVDFGRESDCFWRTRSGQRLDHSVVRDSLNVRSIGQCELECIRSNRFVCRSFSFRYGSAVIGGSIDNCQLTDWPFRELDPRVHMIPDPGFELYERGSFGHGCETNHFIVHGAWDDPHKMNVIPSNNNKLCYVTYGRPARLLPRAIRMGIMVRNEAECQLACTRKREDGPSTCMSYSFRSGRDSRIPRPNCELSDVTQRDLRLNLDYEHDPDYWLFAWDTFNPACVPLNNNPVGLPRPFGPSGPPSGPPPVVPLYPPSRPGSYLPRPGDYLPNRPPSGGDYLPNRPTGGDYLPNRPSGGDWRPPINRPGGYPPVDRVDFGYDFGPNAWQHYTVKGYPCRRGSKCEANLILGYYSCEFEGGEVSSWDYCCRPNHQCGYSEGFDYAWCYVGQKLDQWRKCNDKYYPYGEPTPGNRPMDESGYRQKPIRPGLIAYEERPWVPHPGPSIDRFEPHHPHITEDNFLDPPRPGGFGEPRYWPVAYLHKEPPPVVNQTAERRTDYRYGDRPTQSRMMETPTKNDTAMRVELIPKPTAKDGEYLSYEVIDNTELPEARVSNDSVLTFETVDIVDTADLLNGTDGKTTAVDTTETTLTTLSMDGSQKSKKVQRRNNRLLSRSASLFQTRTGNLPHMSFEDRLNHERRGFIAAL